MLEIHVDLNPVMSLFPPDGGLPHTPTASRTSAWPKGPGYEPVARANKQRVVVQAKPGGMIPTSDGGRGAFPRPPGRERCLVVEVKLPRPLGEPGIIKLVMNKLQTNN